MKLRIIGLALSLSLVLTACGGEASAGGVEGALEKLRAAESMEAEMTLEMDFSLLGQSIETKHFQQAGLPVERGKILTENSGGFSDIPGVFAGGDCATGPATVIKAIAAAKVVAANIDEYLGYNHKITCDVEIPEPDLADKSPCGRVELTERQACERVHDFEGVENCMTDKEACQEAGRCLRCDHFGFGLFKGGREKVW